METKPVWKRNKVWMVLIGVVGVLAIALGGTAIGLDEESRTKAVDAILWLVGLLIGGHTVTDVGSQVAKAMHHKADADEFRARVEYGIVEEDDIDALIPPIVLPKEDDDGRITPNETPMPRGVNVKDR